MSDLRSLITELRPAALDEIGLESALSSLVSRATVADDVEIESDIALPDQVDRLGPGTESTVYRLVQEALTNVSKHAAASHVWLRIALSCENVEISVRDDGVGFDPDAKAEGFGLIGMRERATLAGGELEVYSAQDRGTAIRAMIPIERDAASASKRRQAV